MILGGDIAMPDIDWGNIDNEKISFMLEKAEMQFQSLSISYGFLDKKIDKLRAFQITSITILFSFLKVGHSSLYDFPILVFLIGMCLSFLVSVFIYRTRKYPLIGASPSSLMNDKYLKNDIVFLKCCHYQTYLESINIAKNLNAERANGINYCLLLISITVILALWALLDIYFPFFS